MRTETGAALPLVLLAASDEAAARQRAARVGHHLYLHGVVPTALHQECLASAKQAELPARRHLLLETSPRQPRRTSLVRTQRSFNLQAALQASQAVATARPLPCATLCGLSPYTLKFLQPTAAAAQPGKATAPAPAPAIRSSPPRLYLAFPGLGSDYVGMAEDLMRFAPFAAAMEACEHVLARDAPDMAVGRWLRQGEAVAEQAGAPGLFVTLTAIAVSLVDLLRALGVRPDGFIGHSLGETACGYAAGLLTRREALRCALAQGRAAARVPGSMLSVLASAARVTAALQQRRDLDVHVACYNSDASCTLVGSRANVQEAMALLRDAGLASMAVETAGTACHWPAAYAAVLDDLEAALTQVLGRAPRTRPATWLSTTATTDEGGARTDAGAASPPPLSAGYLARGLAQPVQFARAAARLPAGAVVLEVGARAMLGSLLPPSLGLAPMRMTSKSSPDLPVLAACVGELYVQRLAEAAPAGWLAEAAGGPLTAAVSRKNSGKVRAGAHDSGVGSDASSACSSPRGSPSRSPRSASPEALQASS